MSKYTTELRYICETESGINESVGYSKVKDVIARAIPKIFDFDFPIFDESYKNVLETKILKHYYTREIGLETYGLWKLKLDMKLNEIMPFYNQLYKSTLLEFNPFYDVDMTTSSKKDSSGTRNNDENHSERYSDSTDYDEKHSDSASSSSTNDITRNKGTTDTTTNYYSDTPQGSIQNVIDGTYLTNASITSVGHTGSDTDSGIGSSDSDSDGKSESTTDRSGNRNYTKNNTQNLTDTESYLQTVKGKNGGASYSKLLSEYRETFMNIDMMIIEELSDLFFGLW